MRCSQQSAGKLIPRCRSHLQPPLGNTLGLLQPTGAARGLDPVLLWKEAAEEPPPPCCRLHQRCACQRSLLIMAPVQRQTADRRKEMETTKATLTAIDWLKLVKVCQYSSVTPDQPNPRLFQLTSEAKHLRLNHQDQHEHPYSFPNLS